MCVDLRVAAYLWYYFDCKSFIRKKIGMIKLSNLT